MISDAVPDVPRHGRRVRIETIQRSRLIERYTLSASVRRETSWTATAVLRA